MKLSSSLKIFILLISVNVDVYDIKDNIYRNKMIFNINKNIKKTNYLYNQKLNFLKKFIKN